MHSEARTLAAWGDPVVLRAGARVAACLGVRVVEVASIEALVALRPAAVLWHHRPNQLPAAAEVAAHLPRVPLLLLAEPSPPPDLEALLGQDWLCHLFGLGSPWLMPELAATLVPLLGGPCPGVAGLLPWGSRVVEVPVAGAAAREVVIDQLTAFLATLGIRGRLVDRVAAVVDELVMNAVYDAPHDRTTGQPLLTAQQREPVELAPADQPVFRFGSDGERLVLGIRDPFGALRAGTVRRYLAKGLRRGDDQIDRKYGGAGLGLYLILDGLNSLRFEIEAGRSTEVVGILNIRGSMRDAVNTPKSLNILGGS